MKCSEAMMLGYTMEKMNPYMWDRCLLGLSLKAVADCLKTPYFDEEILHRWPWLTNEFDWPAFAPKETIVGDLKHYRTEWSMKAVDIISFLAYCVEGRQCTLEQVVDWVRSIEPDEEVEQPASTEPATVAA